MYHIIKVQYAARVIAAQEANDFDHIAMLALELATLFSRDLKLR